MTARSAVVSMLAHAGWTSHRTPIEAFAGIGTLALYVAVLSLFVSGFRLLTRPSDNSEWLIAIRDEHFTS
jgi:hypothetical protein